MVAVLLDRVVSENKTVTPTSTSTLGFCYTGEPGRVVVYASDFRDSMQIRDILDSCGFTLDAQLKSEASPDRNTLYGAIVCHKSDQDERTKNILHTLNASRVLVLSNCSDERTIVSMLNHGAHHYIHINQSTTLLAARIGAALRQHNAASLEPFIVGDIQFDIQRRSVSRAGQTVDLSPKEYELAYYLFANSSRIIGNDELMSAVWLLPAHMDTRRIDTAACRVRKKLGLVESRGWELKRIRRVGYRLLQLGTTAESAPVPACQHPVDQFSRRFA